MIDTCIHLKLIFISIPTLQYIFNLILKSWLSFGLVICSTMSPPITILSLSKMSKTDFWKVISADPSSYNILWWQGGTLKYDLLLPIENFQFCWQILCQIQELLNEKYFSITSTGFKKLETIISIQWHFLLLAPTRNDGVGGKWRLRLIIWLFFLIQHSEVKN